MLKALTRTASGKEGGRNSESEVTMTAWQEGPQKLRRDNFIHHALIDKDEDN